MKPKISIKFIICFLPLIFYLAAPLAVVCEGDEAAIDQMEIKRSIQQFKNDDIEIRKKVASSLARYPEAVPLLIKALDDKEIKIGG